MMDIQFEGFQNSIPAVLFSFLVISLAGLSFWSYFRSGELSPLYRSLLISIRFVVFLLLLLILLNPIFTLREPYTVPVHLSYLFDTSQSTTIEKGSYDGEERYLEVIELIIPQRPEIRDMLRTSFFGFDSELVPKEAPPEAQHLTGNRTNIDHALTRFLDEYEDQSAVVLVTDGIVTTGRNPSATAARLPVPLYIVGIGDTSRIHDVVLQNVSNPPVASLNSSMNVQATVLIDGFPNQDIPVQLMKGEQVLDEKVIYTEEERSSQQIRFQLEFEEEGLQQYQIHIPEVSGEWTTKNNTRAFSVDVRDDRLRILHLAFEIHPDVRHVRSFLRTDKNVSLEARTWVEDDRYLEGALPDRPDTLDLVILHGFPHHSMSDEDARA
ncbi:hypothetical protein QLX67_06600, partial [Balneolaceae bacterium ANBcel3]|nr:hypothetical protein [Balneolaceae bacterium ANBcel3]